MKTVTSTQKRGHKRTSLSVSATVKGKDDKAFWTETTELINMSRSGAGFYLERKCEVGRLLSLMIAMPPNLRCYDFDRELYRVFGLVQHCSPLSASGDEDEFHVGVALIGKTPPPSYDENPLQSYRIAGMNHDNTWRVVEAKADFIARKHPRHHVALDVLLSGWNENDKLILDETAKTENVSLTGAAVFSDLAVDVGSSVTFDCIAYNFSAKAIVRNRHESDGEKPKLHLEFIDADFPIERILFPDGKKILDGQEV
jgi:hypothetical protein